MVGIEGPRARARATGKKPRPASWRLGAAASLAVLAGHAGFGQATQLVLPPAPLLPQHFANWSETPGKHGSSGAGARPALLADQRFAAIAKEDGLVRTAAASYTRAGSTAPVAAEALQFEDATGAVAAYTYLRGRPMHETLAQPGARNSVNVAVLGNRALLRDGVSVVLFADAPGMSLADLHALGDTLPKISGPRGLPPLLPTYLPARDLVAGSVTYAVGPVAYQAEGGFLPPQLLGFEKAGEAATAEYLQHDTTGHLTLVLLPTPQIAGDRGHAIEQWLNSPEGKAAVTGEVKLRRVGPLLILVTGLPAGPAAELADSVHLRTELTWSKPVPPEFHAEIRKTVSLLTSILILSGVLGLAAVLLGLFLGFGRAWVRVLMGKPAATEPEFLRLDLRQRNSPGGSGGE